MAVKVLRRVNGLPRGEIKRWLQKQRRKALNKRPIERWVVRNCLTPLNYRHGW